MLDQERAVATARAGRRSGRLMASEPEEN